MDLSTAIAIPHRKTVTPVKGTNKIFSCRSKWVGEGGSECGQGC